MEQNVMPEVKPVLTAQVGAITPEEMAALPAKYQALLNRIASGESYVDIAEVEGLKLGTVRSRINRARAAILAARAAKAAGGSNV